MVGKRKGGGGEQNEGGEMGGERGRKRGDKEKVGDGKRGRSSG